MKLPRAFAADPKIIARLFLLFSLVYLFLGGALALLFRWQLAYPFDPQHPVPVLSWFASLRDGQTLTNQGIFTADFFNSAVTIHATLMIFFVTLPLLIGAFANFLIPAQSGSPKMVFPILSGIWAWALLPAGLILLSGFSLHGGAAGAGWNSLPPLSNISTANPHWPITPLICIGIGWFLSFTYLTRSLLIALPLGAAAAYFTPWIATDGQSCWYLSLLLLSAATIPSILSIIATIFARRPISIALWSLAVPCILLLLVTPILMVTMAISLLDHHHLTSFFEPAGLMLSGVEQFWAHGGNPLLYLHLFDLYAHPVIYIMLLPALGITSDILSHFSQKPPFGRRCTIVAMIAIAPLSFFPHVPLVAIPSAVILFNWLATLWGGQIRFSPAMCYALAVMVMFLVASLLGLFSLIPHYDITYLLVAHLHYLLIGCCLLAAFAGIHFYVAPWMNPRLAYAHFALTFILLITTFLPMLYLGLIGQPRMTANPYLYSTFRDLLPLNKFITWSAIALGFSQILFLLNLLGSLLLRIPIMRG